MKMSNKRIGDMQQSPYRFRAGMMYALIGICAFSFLMSCKKDPAHIPPVISLIQGEGYVSQDTVVTAGTRVRVGIHAAAGNANLTYFSVRFNDGTETILLDTGMNTPALTYNLDVIKTNSSAETWKFLIMDRNRNRDSVQITFTKAEVSTWGKIRTMSGITLGAQENATTGSFFSLDDTAVMNLQQAFAVQPSVDMVYYYGQYECTLASPNETEAPGFFTGPQGIANWTVKNETRYDTTLIIPQAFDTSANDSLILSAYEPTAGKKKGKYLLPGMVLSFRSPAGKLGLVKVLDVAPMPAGLVTLTIKIQE
jgi:hypothetical protein